MKVIGAVLITAGFLAGSFSAVTHSEQVLWSLFAAALLVGGTGVALVRFTELSHSRSSEKVSGDLQTLSTSLQGLRDGVLRIREMRVEDPYKVKALIDELLILHFENFVESRKSLIPAFGLQAYAQVMSSFAGGERYINRVWSASLDGYIDEVNEYLGKAQAELENTCRAFDSAASSRATMSGTRPVFPIVP